LPIESNIEADHLLLHFTPNQWAGDGGLPLITRGEGCWVYDADSKRYFDGLSSLFCSQLGHSVRPSIVQAVIDQLERLPYWTNWTSLHPSAAALATRLGQLAPPGLDRVFFVNSGSEANESAIKLARQYHAARGEPLRYKTISRRLAYHGTTLGALSLTGIPALRSMFEPLMAGARHVSNRTDITAHRGRRRASSSRRCSPS